MQRRLRLILATVMVMGLGVAALPVTPAGANHNTDKHSANLRLEGTLPQQVLRCGTAAQCTNSDLAFWGNRAYAGNYGGFRIIDISNPNNIENPANVISDFNCPGPQNDISVANSDADAAPDLLFLSVDSPRAPIAGPPAQPSTTCGAGASPTGASNPDAWEGVRIFDINVETAPVKIADVPTDCGSHTHTLVPDGPNLYVYVSSYPLGAAALTNDIAANPGATPPRAAGTNNFGTECREPEGADSKAGHNKISIIKVPLASPASADDSTPAPCDPDAAGPRPAQTTGFCYPNVTEVALDGQTRRTERTIGDRVFEFTGCHDIAVYLALDLAASACWEEGQFWDISDPANPRFLRRVRNDAVDTLFHSATFTWDGKMVAFEDEAGGGGDSRCIDPNDLQGRMWWYNTSGRLLGSFKIPRPIPRPEICTAHNYNFLPLTNGKYILASAWYEGGTSMIDATNPRRAREVGFYDANSPVPNSPIASQTTTPQGSNAWSSYWYNGKVYVNDIRRGFEVLTFTSPLTATVQTLPRLNPQTQENLIPQTYSFPSRVSLFFSRGRFSGRVFSAEEQCRDRRRVVIRKARRGRDRTIAVGRTSPTGRFFFFGFTPRPRGRFYAVTSGRNLPSGINTIACLRGRSRTIRL